MAICSLHQLFGAISKHRKVIVHDQLRMHMDKTLPPNHYINWQQVTKLDQTIDQVHASQ